ncbi:MAG: glycoside hydrolase family 16 protein [Planctomycetota bacterium]
MQVLHSPRALGALLTATLVASCASSGTRPMVRPPAFPVTLDGVSGQDFEVEVPVTGRYRLTLDVAVEDPGSFWVEDYVGNDDGRTYDITGPLDAESGGEKVFTVDGSPLQAGTHQMRMHGSGAAEVRSLVLELLREHEITPVTMEQNMVGDSPWKVVWFDEFNGSGLPDSSKWTHDLGDWGWGNREPQYYTDGDKRNARQENGVLVIEARPGDDRRPWTSARLTTRGKVSFLYGRIEIRAQVPGTDGTWAAGWTLGDDYRDEVSWPYCGEIDIMEAVGREIDDASGDGINHGSCHTRAYYFKQGNHISNTIPVEGMADEFHVYACEWDKDEVRMYVDDVHYYTYSQHESPEAWPFDRPQNLILNLAMGGGMGGAIDPKASKFGATPQRILVDYVRVLGRR